MRVRLLEAATREIMTRGFAATTVDAICLGAGASKGSFYHFFPSKADIGVAVLETWFVRVREVGEGGPYQTESQPDKRLTGYLNHLKNISQGLWGRGSVLAAIVTELGPPGEELTLACRRLLGEACAQPAELLAPVAATLGDVSRQNDLARLLMAVIEGASVLARAEGRPETSRDVLDTFQLCLRKILEYSRESK